MSSIIKLNANTINEIRRILLLNWDPLGIGDNSMIYDEYDQYIPRIYHCVMNCNCVEYITDTLFEIENTELEIHRDKLFATDTANRLFSLRHI